MSLGHEHGLVLIGLAGPMDVVNLSLSLSWASKAYEDESVFMSEAHLGWQ